MSESLHYIFRQSTQHILEISSFDLNGANMSIIRGDLLNPGRVFIHASPSFFIVAHFQSQPLAAFK